MNAFKDIEQKAQATLLKEEQAVKAWFGSNKITLSVGVAIGALVMWLIEAAIHHI